MNDVVNGTDKTRSHDALKGAISTTFGRLPIDVSRRLVHTVPKITEGVEGCRAVQRTLSRGLYLFKRQTACSILCPAPYDQHSDLRSQIPMRQSHYHAVDP